VKESETLTALLESVGLSARKSGSIVPVSHTPRL
jgi:hypothetical protein